MEEGIRWSGNVPLLLHAITFVGVGGGISANGRRCRSGRVSGNGSAALAISQRIAHGHLGRSDRRERSLQRIVTSCVVFCHPERDNGAEIALFVFHDFLLFRNGIAIAENPRQITHLHGDLY